MGNKLNRIHTLTAAGVLVSLGIIYGDIGTSPLYVFRAIVGKDTIITEDLVLGGMSCVFWTLMIITTLKYVYLALNADNKGEGGICVVCPRKEIQGELGDLSRHHRVLHNHRRQVHHSA